MLVANLPLIIAALRWNWLTGLRLVGQTPAPWDLDAEIMWLLIAVACFGLNVFNLIVVYQQADSIVRQVRYRQGSWLLALLIMAGLVVCWSQPANLMTPHRFSGLLVAAMIIIACQALVGNYFLQVVSGSQQPFSSLAIPTLTWLGAALLGWPRQVTAGSDHFLAVVMMVILVAGLLLGQAQNVIRMLNDDSSAGLKTYKLLSGMAVASWLSAALAGLFRGWLIVVGGWPGFINLILAVNLIVLAASTQLAAIVTRRLPTSGDDLSSWPVIAGAVLAVLIEIGVAAATF